MHILVAFASTAPSLVTSNDVHNFRWKFPASKTFNIFHTPTIITDVFSYDFYCGELVFLFVPCGHRLFKYQSTACLTRRALKNQTNIATYACLQKRKSADKMGRKPRCLYEMRIPWPCAFRQNTEILFFRSWKLSPQMRCFIIINFRSLQKFSS